MDEQEFQSLARHAANLGDGTESFSYLNEFWRDHFTPEVNNKLIIVYTFVPSLYIPWCHLGSCDEKMCQADLLVNDLIRYEEKAIGSEDGKK